MQPLSFSSSSYLATFLPLLSFKLFPQSSFTSARQASIASTNSVQNLADPIELALFSGLKSQARGQTLSRPSAFIQIPTSSGPTIITTPTNDDQQTTTTMAMLPAHNMYQRPAQSSRTPSSSTLSQISSSASRLNLATLQTVSRFSQSREPLLPSAAPVDAPSGSRMSPGGSAGGSENSPMILGMPLKYVSCVVSSIQSKLSYCMILGPCSMRFMHYDCPCISQTGTVGQRKVYAL